MCGIIGIYNSNNKLDIYDIILSGLKQLQNRGYDSAGISILNNNNFDIVKFASTDKITAIDNLITHSKIYNNNIGMGHNRWATHGGKTDINSHPHVSNDKIFCLVHNGIIENYLELKKFLIENNFIFYSQTDTEVIVNLISYFYKITNDTVSSIIEATNKLEGTFGLCISNKNENDKLYCIRNGSPLLIGINEELILISSEQSGFIGLIKSYITLDNHDLCIIDNMKVKTTRSYKKINITDQNLDLTPYPFDFWTIKEIYSQPKCILNTLNNGARIFNDFNVKLGGLESNSELSNIDNIILLGCGTSFFSAQYASKFFKELCNFNTIQCFDGADFESSDIPKSGKTIFILISQSGETFDLYRCIKIAEEFNILTLGIVNVVDSLIAREVSCGVYINAGRENGVASTKSFTCQIITLTLVACWFAQKNNWNINKRKQVIHDLQNLSNDFENIINDLDNNIQNMVNLFDNFNNMFILGKGYDEIIAKEGALKIKEISYIHSEGYSASALKHGPFALLDENMPVILLDCDNYHNKIMNCYEEIASRNAPIIIITNNNLNNIKNVIKIKKNKTFHSLLAIIPLQLLAYYLSRARNINPDIPKNLAKVVTVE
jgi:glucosamine--fructose-6-phosphate aminotransferase (isomerizing)